MSFSLFNPSSWLCQCFPQRLYMSIDMMSSSMYSWWEGDRLAEIASLREEQKQKEIQKVILGSPPSSHVNLNIRICSVCYNASYEPTCSLLVCVSGNRRSQEATQVDAA